jgi:hypothetical protein
LSEGTGIGPISVPRINRNWFEMSPKTTPVSVKSVNTFGIIKNKADFYPLDSSTPFGISFSQ